MDANGGRVSARPERVHPSRLAAWVIGAVLPLWGAELVLSRLTGIPQPASDILLAFVFWGVVGACTWVATILAGTLRA